MTGLFHNPRRVNIIQGEYKVSDDPEVVLSTILGSCVGVCIRVPVAKIGGMNHFLLPGKNVDGASPGMDANTVHLMELLVNGVMRRGGLRDRLEAKIFGGAKMIIGISDIGRLNAQFAKRFLEYEGIRILSSDTGGERGRRLQYWPVSGRAMQSYIAPVDDASPKPTTRRHAPPSVGDAELFRRFERV